MPKPARSSSAAKLASLLLLVGILTTGWLLLRATPPAAAPPSELAASARPPQATPEPHEEEKRLFQAAQAALAAGDTDSAFSLLYEQATKFPKGALAGAREVTHATTLCRVGKKAEARAEAAEFVAAHPESPLSKDARLICAP